MKTIHFYELDGGDGYCIAGGPLKGFKKDSFRYLGREEVPLEKVKEVMKRFYSLWIESRQGYGNRLEFLLKKVVSDH